MEQIRAFTPDEPRDLLALATELRRSASETSDENYIRLFLRAAIALEEHASNPTSSMKKAG
jgi:hypothetical protein